MGYDFMTYPFQHISLEKQLEWRGSQALGLTSFFRSKAGNALLYLRSASGETPHSEGQCFVCFQPNASLAVASPVTRVGCLSGSHACSLAA